MHRPFLAAPAVFLDWSPSALAGSRVGLVRDPEAIRLILSGAEPPVLIVVPLPRAGIPEFPNPR